MHRKEMCGLCQAAGLVQINTETLAHFLTYVVPPALLSHSQQDKVDNG